MAVAGLPNISPFRPSWFENDRAGSSTRASSLLQLWREIEGEHAVSDSPRLLRPQRNGSDSESVRSLISEVGDETENHEDNNSVVSEQSSDLGETERERVRQIFREWMNNNGSNRSRPQLEEMINSQQRNGQEPGVVDGAAEGLGRAVQARRPIRKLCGRQTLLDLLSRAQCERKEEIQCLSERRPVSEFPHRNRIQALLRGRFLRNERPISDKRPSSVAATELGLLRQRQTVSDLREGFLSKSENCAPTSVNSSVSDSSSNHGNNDASESTICIEKEETGFPTTSDLGNDDADENRSRQEFVVQVTEVEYPVADNTINEQEVSSDNRGHVEEVSPEVLDNETSDQLNTIITANESPLETEDIVGPVEVHDDDYEMGSGDSYSTDSEENENEELEESEVEINEDSDWQRVTGNWHETSDGQWFRETSGSDAIERDHMHEACEDSWPSHDLEEAIDSWLQIPSGEVDPSLARVDTFYFPEDDYDNDNAHRMEIRELFSRRRVSSLLGSGFRESLNQVLQSHVERLGHVSDDWELDNIEEDQQPSNGYYHQALSLSDGADRNQFAPSSNLVSESEPLWEEEFQETNSPRNNLNQQFETEWEVINELRTDMVRLQHRLNNMQSMLEACMDMQLELQRSVRQEVSAALNRTTPTSNSDASKGVTLDDESQWNHVRKGICCLCSDSKIDSLLYRCGHMCTCSNCAEKLVQGKGKCPMCRAPVVEAVRAYFTQ